MTAKKSKAKKPTSKPEAGATVADQMKVIARALEDTRMSFKGIARALEDTRMSFKGIARAFEGNAGVLVALDAFVDALQVMLPEDAAIAGAELKAKIEALVNG